MMEFFQSIVRSFFGKVILGIICLGMALWGFGDTFSRAMDSSLAASGKNRFTVSDLNMIVEQQQRMMGQNGAYVAKAELVENGMIDQIFDIFSDQTALLGYGEKYGIKASEDEIWADIKTDSRFLDVSGKFSLSTYQNYVERGFNMSVSDYEKRLRNDETIGYMSGALEGFTPQTGTFDAVEFAYNNETRHISWMRLPVKSALEEGAANADEDALRAYYNANSALYFKEETRTIDVLYVSAKDFLHKVDVTDEALEVFYETIKETDFALPTPRRFDEILFDTEAQAKASIGVLGAGGSASGLDGFSGVNSRTALQSELEGTELAEVFSPYAQESQILGVREIDGKWAVTRITEIPPVQTRPFDEVREQVETKLREQQGLRLFFEAVEPIDIEIASGATISELAELFGVPLISLNAISSDGTGPTGIKNSLLSLSQDALDQVFILETGEFTDLFEFGEIDPGRGQQPRGAIILETRKISEGHLPEFEDIKSEVEKDFLADAEKKAFDTFKTDRLADLISGEKGFQETADDYGVQIEASGEGGVKRLEIGSLGLPANAQGAIFDGHVGDITAWEDGEFLLILKIDEILAARPDPLSVQIQPSSVMLETNLQRDLTEAFQLDAKAASGLQLNRQYLEAYKRQAKNSG